MNSSSSRNSLNINNLTITSPSKQIQSLENYCLDYVLWKLDLFNMEQSFTREIKEKLLQRMLGLYKSKFTIVGVPQPQPTLARVNQLINFESTSHLDLSSISNWNSLTKNSFQFLSQCKGITSFTMSGFSSITSDKILPILEMIGHSLHRLDLSRCPRLNDTVIHYISFYCPNLEYLNLEDCIGISGAVFQRASKYDHINNKLNLIILSQTSSSSNSQYNNNTASNNNTTVNINNQTQQKQQQKSVFMNKMNNLIELNLSGCKSINSKNLYCLKSAFPILKMFSFGKNFLSDEDGALLVQTLPSTLMSLDLSFNPIGKLTLLALVPNTRNNWTSFHLKSLSLGYCRCINANDLTTMLSGIYKSLEYLSIPGCFQIDKSFLDQILLSSSSSYSLINLNNNSITPNNINSINLTNSGNSNNTTTNTSTINNNNNKRKSTGVVALKTLDISYCSQFLSSSTLLKFNQNCKVQILKYNNIGFNHNHIYKI